VNGHEIYKTSNDIVSIGGSVHPGLQSLRLQLFIIWEEYEMTKEKAIKEKRKLLLTTSHGKVGLRYSPWPSHWELQSVIFYKKFVKGS
jgi:hypothetical protein